MKCIFICVGILNIFFTLGCSVNPVSGKSELLLTNEHEDILFSKEIFASARQVQGGDYNADPDLQKYIRDIGDRLAANSDHPELPYEFVLVNSAIPNAWALPGGKISINRGLLLHLTDEAQLAAVLAHDCPFWVGPARHGIRPGRHAKISERRGRHLAPLFPQRAAGGEGQRH